MSVRIPAPASRPVGPGGETEAVVRAGLDRALRMLEHEGMPAFPLSGKLLRPRVAYLGVPDDVLPFLDDRFWLGALAIQLVHEASLVHDDVVDGADRRRGRPTVVAAQGVGAAVVRGDHLLTSAYRAASMTGSLPFLSLFTEAVERTVAGELAQGRARGRILDTDEYRAIVGMKTGRLFGCALAVSGALHRPEETERLARLGERLGVLYQMLDDLLDFCPEAGTGKPPFQDYRTRVWTWPLADLGTDAFSWTSDTIGRALATRGPGGTSALDRGLRTLRSDAARLETDLRSLSAGGEALASMVRAWMRRVAQARARLSSVAFSRDGADADAPAALPPPPRTVSRTGPPPVDAAARVADRARSVGEPAAWPGYFAHHSRSFRFAARLFPPEARERVTEVYAFCRFTDDLVDRRTDVAPDQLLRELRAWRSMARSAYDGQRTGVPLADRAMGEMARQGVPFHYVHELLEGVGMDVEPREFESMSDLRTYTYRVASVVGGWLTELFGSNDPWLLTRAFSLGHAMQLTNILRDVGEDLRNGRLYLPIDALERHGITRTDLLDMSERGQVSLAYHGLIEELIGVAEEDYALAFEAIPGLPPFFRRPVAVAAHVYRGIHGAIRRNGYDNLGRRAHTGPLRKVWLGAAGLLALRGAQAWRSAPFTPRTWPTLAVADRGES